MTALAPTLEAFFIRRLINEKGVSPHTIAAYRDTFRLLLSFAQQRTGKQPCKLEIEDLDAPLISGVPRPPRTRPRQQPPHPQCPPGSDPLDVPVRRAQAPRARGADQPRARCPDQTVRPRDRHPPHRRRSRHPARRARPKPLDRTARPRAADHRDPDRRAGLRTHRLRCQDVHLGTGAHVQTAGKGRKQRATPLTKQTVAVLREWLKERDGQSSQPLFPTSRGKPLSRDAEISANNSSLRCVSATCASTTSAVAAGT